MSGQMQVVEPLTPPTLAAAYARAQARLRVSRAASFCDQYSPLMQLMEQAWQLGGAYATAALEACTEIAAADEPAMERMVAMRRAAPSQPNGAEVAAVRAAAQAHANRTVAEMAALANRPRISLTEQLSAMEARGIRIAAKGRHLQVHAPDGVLTDADRTLLREHKPNILAWLTDGGEVI